MSASIDLLVGGGGPGGAAVAILAAEAGLHVLVAERERFPRGKVCGEFVSAEGCRVLERLGVLASLVGSDARWIDSCAIVAGKRARIEAPLPDLGGGRRAGIGVSRELLDRVLLDRARASGATVLERHSVAPLDVGARTLGASVRRVGADRPGERIDARVIVAADGRASAFAGRGAGRPRRPTRDRSWFGLQVHLHEASAALDRRVELHAFDGGYAGLCAVEEQRINACLLVRVGALRAAGGDPARLFAERVLVEPSVRGAVGQAEPCSAWHAVGPLHWGVARPAARGILFVGDAAGTIDPLCGEGMSHALRAAELALPHIVRAAEMGGLDPRIERAYACAWRGEFRTATRRARALGSILERRPLARVVLGTLALGAAPLARPLVAWSRTGVPAARS